MPPRGHVSNDAEKHRLEIVTGPIIDREHLTVVIAEAERAEGSRLLHCGIAPDPVETVRVIGSRRMEVGKKEISGERRSPEVHHQRGPNQSIPKRRSSPFGSFALSTPEPQIRQKEQNRADHAEGGPHNHVRPIDGGRYHSKSKPPVATINVVMKEP
jgi:hypothetical protein